MISSRNHRQVHIDRNALELRGTAEGISVSLDDQHRYLRGDLSSPIPFGPPRRMEGETEADRTRDVTIRPSHAPEGHAGPGTSTTHNPRHGHIRGRGQVAQAVQPGNVKTRWCNGNPATTNPPRLLDPNHVEPGRRKLRSKHSQVASIHTPSGAVPEDQRASWGPTSDRVVKV